MLLMTLPSLLRRAAIAALLAALSVLVVPGAALAAIVARGLVTTADGKPIQGAEIALDGNWTGVMTGPDGRFALPTLKAGTLRVGIRHERYASIEQAFDLQEGDAPSWTFVLAERGPEPPSTRPPARELLQSEVLGAFKLPIEQRELPQHATIVTRDELRDRDAFDLHGAMRGVAGVIALPDDGSGALDVMFRGQSPRLASRSLRDGELEPAGMPHDLVGIERLELLHGVGSALEDGTGTHGGTLMAVSKHPQLQSLGELRVTGDSWGRVRTTIDQGAPLGASRATYRVNAALGRNLGFRDGTRRGQSLAFAPVFDVPLGELTHVTARGEYVRRDFTPDPGLPLAEASLHVPVTRFVGEPDDDAIAEGGAAQLELTHFLEGDVQLRQSLSYRADSNRGRRVTLTGLDANGFATRESRDANTRAQVLTSQSELIAQVHAGRFVHAIVTGLEVASGASAGNERIDSLAEISLSAPIHGAAPVRTGPRDEFRAPTHHVAFFAQDLVRLHTRLRLLVSGRWQQDHVERRGAFATDSLAGTTRSALDATVAALTGRAGLVFQPTRRGRLFVLAGHGAAPSPAPSERGDRPGVLRERATQYELGWKQETLSGRFAWTVSAYSLTSRDVRTRLPFASIVRESWRIGAQRSTGCEGDAAGQIGDALRVTLGYGYTDTRITDPGETPVTKGTRLPMSPRHQAAMWAVYRVPAGRAAGLDVGVGLIAQSDRTSALANGPTLPAFHEIDLMLGYGRRRWQAQVDVRDLTDAKGFDAMPGQFVMPRESRSLRGSVVVRF